MAFSWRNKKNTNTFQLNKKTTLSGAITMYHGLYIFIQKYNLMIQTDYYVTPPPTPSTTSITHHHYHQRLQTHIVFGTDPIGVCFSVSVKLLICSITQIPFEIFWWHVTYKSNNSGFLTFGVISLCFVRNRYCVRSVTPIPFRIYFDGTW